MKPLTKIYDELKASAVDPADKPYNALIRYVEHKVTQAICRCEKQIEVDVSKAKQSKFIEELSAAGFSLICKYEFYLPEEDKNYIHYLIFWK